MEGLIQILEYFPDKLKVNDITPEQKRFVLAALDSVSRNIDSFLSLMPADEVGLTLTLTLTLALTLALALALALTLALALALTLTLAVADVGPRPQTKPCNNFRSPQRATRLRRPRTKSKRRTG